VRAVAPGSVDVERMDQHKKTSPLSLYAAGVGLFIVGALLGNMTFPSGAVRDIVALSAGPGWTASECSRSLEESDGFYCESEDQWTKRIEVVRKRSPDQCAKLACQRWDSLQFYWRNFEQEWSCFEERIGDYGAMGKWVCDTNLIRRKALKTKQPCLLYSVGFNESYSFESAFHESLPECDIFAIHTDNKAPAPPSYVKHKSWNVAGKPLQSIMNDLGHEGREIDVLKVELYGGEYELFSKLFRDKFMPFRQILLKVHAVSEIGSHYTELRNLFAQLRRFGFVIAHKELYYANVLTHQYVMMRLAPNLFTEIVPDEVLGSLTL